LREYYASLVEENIYNKEAIKVKEKWNIDLSILFVEEGSRFNATDIFFPNKPRTVIIKIKRRSL